MSQLWACEDAPSDMKHSVEIRSQAPNIIESESCESRSSPAETLAGIARSLRNDVAAKMVAMSKNVAAALCKPMSCTRSLGLPLPASKYRPQPSRYPTPAYLLQSAVLCIGKPHQCTSPASQRPPLELALTCGHMVLEGIGCLGCSILRLYSYF